MFGATHPVLHNLGDSQKIIKKNNRSYVCPTEGPGLRVPEVRVPSWVQGSRFRVPVAVPVVVVVVVVAVRACPDAGRAFPAFRIQARVRIRVGVIRVAEGP